ncbi:MULTISPECIES: protein-L-isoaspartate O-methyltransferase [Methanobacterium]|jgi:protein-L-isoaspartate(D-aspartate) O-methyltransferase|uniref:Protein-L-isoaspartate O-methyltransferase n=1 Tax=Methanobacterium subterraneum TaxID=59277 RepID=A0A7K4DNL0_9EURY|nr:MULTISPECIES: protein-L-isoaspartate O-methyltransferase [Methanobacterium]AUB58472.1 protein-L-isoaspartate O-methyltransferase [Methanobacterium sp. MZ-A1]NMO09596.1 protein-L-isoaspartate O-methyltransferase [Methanobacterium subterraneum]
MKEKRKDLVEKLFNQGYINTEKVKEAMLKVPREEFMPPENSSYAYLDRPFPIGKGQTISAPHMVTIIAEKLELTDGMSILEIGTGLGYNAAVVAEIAGNEGHVYTIERIPALVEKSRENLNKTGYSDRVTVIEGDGTIGYPDKAPYDRIYGTASAPKIPEPLKKQLKIGGKLIMPMGSDYYQELVLVMRISDDDFQTRNLGGVVFVPMIGKHGWPEGK